MSIRITDLTYAQIRLLIRLDVKQTIYGRTVDDEYPGMEIGDLRESEVLPMRQLLHKRLIRIDGGWRGTVWLRLTERGQALRETGWVA